MKLFFIANRSKVLERWGKLLQGWQPNSITIGELLSGKVSENSVLMLHVSSLSDDESREVFNFKKNHPGTILIVCTDIPNEQEGVEVLQNGANGYTNTYVTGSLLSEVVTTVLRGDIWAGPELLQKLLKRLLAGSQVTDRKVDTTKTVNCFENLSSREQDVLSILVTGVSNKEIARELGITERTIKAHLSSVFQKTGAKDRISLILLAKNSNAWNGVLQ
ncbi:MAG: response regulator transcription factor [Neptuniibacter sp.]